MGVNEKENSLDLLEVSLLRWHHHVWVASAPLVLIAWVFSSRAGPQPCTWEGSTGPQLHCHQCLTSGRTLRSPVGAGLCYPLPSRAEWKWELRTGSKEVFYREPRSSQGRDRFGPEPPAAAQEAWKSFSSGPDWGRLFYIHCYFGFIHGFHWGHICSDISSVGAWDS